MKTIEQLEAELRDAIARERQLRDALEWMSQRRACIIFAEEPEHVSEFFVRADKALSTPAPRVFTLDEVMPLVEALRGYTLCKDSWDHDAALATLDYARKLGMEETP